MGGVDGSVEVTGSLGVLNVGAGDIEVNFNNHDPREADKAIKMLMDMKDRGYAILVRNSEDGSYQRAVDIDASRGRYILMLPEHAALKPDEELVEPVSPRGRKRGRKKVSAPITKRQAVAVARSAGG